LRTKLAYWSVLPAIATALPFAWLGAKAVASIDKETLKPLIIVMFSIVAVYTFIKKDFGKAGSKQLANRKSLWLALITGAVIGFYDGFFGPGTGSFLVFIYVFLFGFDFLQASASAKIVNATTNIAALCFFISNGQIVFQVAIPVAVFNMAGSVLGTNMAIKKGSGFIRIAFLAVICIFIAKMTWDVLTR
ncbi:MAG: sulfite exporter TauE/SafE family protein, partial [Bacteroidia bacterium]